MNRTTTIRRIASTAGTAGLISLGTFVPASAVPDPGFPGSTGDPGHSQTEQSGVRQVFIDDNALEYVQIGLGALAGVTLAGAAAFGLRRMERHAPHPA